MMTRLLTYFLFAALPQSTLAAAPPVASTEPVWIDVKPIRVGTFRGASSAVADIDRYLDAWGVGQVSNLTSPSTYAHESAHMVSATLTNARGRGVNVFYVGDGKACVLKEPHTSIGRAAQFVPSHLRGGRFQTYLTGEQQRSWNDRPLYLLDEWTAYIWGAKAALSQAREGLAFNRNEDTAVGQIEFIPYVLAVYVAAETDDPAYVAGPDGEQLRRFIRWSIQRAVKQYEECQSVDGLKWFYEVKVSADPRLKAAYDRIMGVTLPQSTLTPRTPLPQATIQTTPIRQTPAFVQDCPPGGT